MIKIAHFADIHYRSLSRHEEYKHSFTDAFKKLRKLKPDIIFIAGDIVHSKTQGISPELITHLTWWFNGLAEIAEVHVTLGNHDGLILNPDREDAITPILAAINNPKIKLYKQSGVYKLKDEYNLCVFSCFDEQGWERVKPEPSKINIATFHGPMAGIESGENWANGSNVDVSFFNGYDYTMLGDIHQQQFMTKTMAYAGSAIAQNYSESPGKGFLFWEIDGKKFTAKHVEIDHVCPYVTLNYSGDLDELQSEMERHPPRASVRVAIQSNVTQGEMSQIRAAIKSVATPSEIVFKREVNDQEVNISDAILDESSQLDSYESVNSLVREYYSQSTKVDAKMLDVVSKTLLSIWNGAKVTETTAAGRWSIRKLMFDNIFGYGENNLVNFDSASGITGIFGKNRSGKSSVCGALTYTLFNGTDRGPIKNIHIVNARKGYCRGAAIVTKKDQNFFVERQTTKRTTRTGITHASTHLNLFRCNEDGERQKDLSEEQRRETEKILKDIVGSLDDFLLTSLASQGDINRFVSHGSTTRKGILSRFLRLDILDVLFEQTKVELAGAKKVLSKVPEKQFDTQIVDKSMKVHARTQERNLEISAVEKITVILNDINLSLGSKSTDAYTQIEIDDQTKKIDDLKNKIENLATEKTEISVSNEVATSTIEELEAQISEIDFAEVIQTKQDIAESERSLLLTSGSIEQKTSELKNDKQKVKKLSDVPCGDMFPACKYIISAEKAKSNMQQKKEEITDLKKYAAALRSSLKKMLQKNVDEKLAQKQSYDEKKYALLKEISDCKLKSLAIDGTMEGYKRQLSHDRAILSKMKLNICSPESAKEREILVKKKKIAEAKLSEAKTNVQNLSERIGLLRSEISQLEKDKATYEENKQIVTVLTLLSKALGRDGIPLQIVKKKLPAINFEIASILQGVTGFTVELVVDNTSGMDIILNYGDSQRVIECCSGMEKMMSSLAIRTALIRISSLPKSDILIIDEGFGALDETNIEACTALLRSLTKTFKSIIIISHVDTVKDVVDNIIEISSSKGHDSKVNFP